jgi:hypothetical protein
MALTTPYTTAVHEIADDIIRQMDDGHAPHRRSPTLAAGGYYFESVRVFYADIHGTDMIPNGVARVALDVSPTNARRPAHEVRVSFDAHDYDAGEAAADIAAAVLDMIDPMAAYAR